VTGPGRHSPLKGTRPRWRGVLIRVSISGAILGGLLAYLPSEALWTSLGRISFFEWGITLVGCLAAHLLGVFKWQIALGVSGVRLRWVDAAQCYAAGLFANLFLPSLVGGDVVRIGLVMRMTGRKEASLVGSLLDRFIDVMALGLLAAGGGLLTSGALGPNGRFILALVASGVGFVILLSLLLIRRRPSGGWSGRTRRRIARVRVALRAGARRTPLAGLALGVGIGIQAALVLLNAFLGVTVGLWVPLRVWFLTLPLAKVVALLPVSLAGVGVREVALAGLLQPFGVAAPLAVAQQLVWETILVATGLIAGLIWWGMSMVRRESLIQPQTATAYSRGRFRGDEESTRVSHEVPAGPRVKGRFVR
jgi:glycosyltransferase 2 family protein